MKRRLTIVEMTLINKHYQKPCKKLELDVLKDNEGDYDKKYMRFNLLMINSYSLCKIIKR